MDENEYRIILEDAMNRSVIGAIWLRRAGSSRCDDQSARHADPAFNDLQNAGGRN
jgi:hypothetical protein